MPPRFVSPKFLRSTAACTSALLLLLAGCNRIEPAPEETPTPRPSPQPALPTPAEITPAPSATPAPTPAPIDLGALPREQWPKQVALRTSIDVPAIISGRVVGQAELKPGTIVSLISIQGERLVIDYLGSRATIAEEKTDLRERLRQIAALPPPTAAPPPAVALATRVVAPPTPTLTSPQPNASIKLVTWNLEWFPGGNPDAGDAQQKRQMKAAQAAITKLSPDILCVQEVRDWSAVSELVSVLPGFEVHVVSSFYGKQQQAIASRLPVDSAWAAEWHSGGRNDPPRGYSFAAISGRQITYLVYSLHLKANGKDTGERDIAKREESSRQLRAHVAEMEKIYGRRGKVAVVLCGDWNTTLDPEPRFDKEKTLRDFLKAGFHWTGENVPFSDRDSHPGSGGFPAIEFDHVFTKGLAPAKCKVIAMPGVSDHQPVEVELR